MLIATLPELGHLNRQQIAALAGLAPFANESGKWTGQRSIWGGRSAVRCALYMAALSAKTHNPVIRAFAKRISDQGQTLQSRDHRLHAKAADTSQRQGQNKLNLERKCLKTA